MDINKAMKICLSNGIKVYPVVKDRMLVVAIENSKGVKQGDIKHTTATINKAIVNTWFYMAEKINNN